MSVDQNHREIITKAAEIEDGDKSELVHKVRVKQNGTPIPTTESSVSSLAKTNVDPVTTSEETIPANPGRRILILASEGSGNYFCDFETGVDNNDLRFTRNNPLIIEDYDGPVYYKKGSGSGAINYWEG